MSKFVKAIGVIIGVMFLFSPVSSQAVIVGDGDYDMHLVNPYRDSILNGVGRIGSNLSGVLIDRWHIITAAHVGNVTNCTFTLFLPGRIFTAKLTASTVRVGDLAIWTLDTPAPINGYQLYTASDEQGKEVIVSGYGYGGLNGIYNPFDYARGALRAGWNEINSASYSSLSFDFDAPEASPQEKPYFGNNNDVGIAVGDSGGGTFILDNGVLKLAGIHSGASPNGGSSSQYYTSFYGQRFSDTRVSYYSNWIQDNLSSLGQPQFGDINRDGLLNAIDKSLLCASLVGRRPYTPGAAKWTDGDLDADGYVTLLDKELIILAINRLPIPDLTFSSPGDIPIKVTETDASIPVNTEVIARITVQAQQAKQVVAAGGMKRMTRSMDMYHTLKGGSLYDVLKN